MLAITDFNSTVHDGTYVCRTSNVAGQDAAIVALSSRKKTTASNAYNKCLCRYNV